MSNAGQMFSATALSEQPLECHSCSACNRLLYRFCRCCGTPNASGAWSTRGGGWDYPEGSLALSNDLRVHPGSQPAHSLLAWGGVILSCSLNGQLAAYCDTVLERNLSFQAQVGPMQASPTLIDGLLLTAGEQGLQSFHLSRLLGIEPGRRLRDSRHGLPAPPRSDLAGDGQKRAALVAGDQLLAFEARPDGLQPLWSAPVGRETGEARLSFGPEHVVFGSTAGQLAVFQASNGRLLHQEKLAEGIAPGGLLVRQLAGGPALLIAGARGSLHRLELRPPWNWICLAEPGDQLCFGLGASNHDAVLSHGRRLRHVRLDSGRCFAFEVPQHCVTDPLVGHASAVLLSHEGTLYGARLEGDNPRVVYGRKLFTSYEPVQAAPIFTANSICLAGPEGEVVLVGRSV